MAEVTPKGVVVMPAKTLGMIYVERPGAWSRIIGLDADNDNYRATIYRLQQG
jgi:hypothetical protein